MNRVVIAIPPPAKESNAPRLLGQIDMFQLRPMYDYLMGLDAETGKIVPGLATEWKLESDGKSYRFKLRQGVRFQKGYGEVSAKDVVFTETDFIQEDSTHPDAPIHRKVIKEVKPVNDYEVIVEMAVPDANILNNLSEGEGTFQILSKAHFDSKGAPSAQTEPTVGTGPYQFISREQAVYIRFERTPYQHWKYRSPDFPEFEFRFIKESSTRVAALLTGEVHVASLPQDLIDQARQAGMKTVRGRVPGLRTLVSFYGAYLNDPFDASKGYKYPNSPFVDVKVRKALNHAVNREELNKKFFAGQGELMYNHHHHATRKGWNPDWEKRFQEEYGYNPTKAKALLAEAGYGPTKPLKTNMLILPLAAYAGAEDVAEVIANYWRAIGVDVELLQLDPALVSRRRFELGFDNHAAITATSSALLIGQVYTSTSGGRENGFLAVQVPEVERIVAEIYKTLDEEKQEKLWRELGEVLFQNYSGVPLFWLPAEAVVNPKIVADYVWPGSISGTWTHVQNIKAAN